MAFGLWPQLFSDLQKRNIHASSGRKHCRKLHWAKWQWALAVVVLAGRDVITNPATSPPDQAVALGSSLVHFLLFSPTGTFNRQRLSSNHLRESLANSKPGLTWVVHKSNKRGWVSCRHTFLQAPKQRTFCDADKDSLLPFPTCSREEKLLLVSIPIASHRCAERSPYPRQPSCPHRLPALIDSRHQFQSTSTQHWNDESRLAFSTTPSLLSRRLSSPRSHHGEAGLQPRLLRGS